MSAGGARGVTVRDRLLAALSPDVVDAIEILVAERVREEFRAAHREGQADGAGWLTLEQAGDQLGCTADAVRMRIKRGRLESRNQGRRVYVSAASVERLA